MQIKPKVTINFWDDFYDDGYVPEGKDQESHVAIDDAPADINHQELLLWLKDKITPLFPKTSLEVVFYDSRSEYPNSKPEDTWHYQRWQLNMKHLTHVELEDFIYKTSKKLIHPDYDLSIYSES